MFCPTATNIPLPPEFEALAVVRGVIGGVGIVIVDCGCGDHVIPGENVSDGMLEQSK